VSSSRPSVGPATTTAPVPRGCTPNLYSSAHRAIPTAAARASQRWPSNTAASMPQPPRLAIPASRCCRMLLLNLRWVEMAAVLPSRMYVAFQHLRGSQPRTACRRRIARSARARASACDSAWPLATREPPLATSISSQSHTPALIGLTKIRRRPRRKVTVHFDSIARSIFHRLRCDSVYGPTALGYFGVPVL
jgi:hypothetical protein